MRAVFRLAQDKYLVVAVYLNHPVLHSFINTTPQVYVVRYCGTVCVVKQSCVCVATARLSEVIPRQMHLRLFTKVFVKGPLITVILYHMPDGLHTMLELVKLCVKHAADSVEVVETEK